MATSKNPDLTKKTLNLRTGDFEKMGELFPKLDPSVAIRELIAAFVNKHYTNPTPPKSDLNIEL